MGKLARFGKDSSAEAYGYDLPLIIGWLESMIADESDKPMNKPREQRLAKAEEAARLLNEIADLQ